jgi:hypothetical protein
VDVISERAADIRQCDVQLFQTLLDVHLSLPTAQWRIILVVIFANAAAIKSAALSKRRPRESGAQGR